MITLLVLEDEQKIYKLFVEALKNEGYCLLDGVGSKGIIKIVKKAKQANSFSSDDKIFDLDNILFKAKDGLIYQSIISEVEKPLIETILERVEGNQLKASKLLGINRNTLRMKMKKLGINFDKWKAR